MSGCFGNSFEDRCMEHLLNEYLAEGDEIDEDEADRLAGQAEDAAEARAESQAEARAERSQRDSRDD